MKLSATVTTAAAVAIGGTSVMVQAKKRADTKSSKSDGEGEDSLKEYSYTKPANFEGVYHTCRTSIIRNSATGIGTGTFHTCFDENTPSWFKRGTLNFTQTDAYGAYQVESIFDPVNFVDNMVTKSQGFAKGDTIHLTTFGKGSITAVTDVVQHIIHNDTPDTTVCQLKKGRILECTQTLSEFCSPESLNDFTFPFCKDNVGQWLNTYTLDIVLATDIANCPAPPGDFCETNPVPPIHPLDHNNRHLEDDEDDDGNRHPCPVLAGMYA
jgi:hypothetical protein